MSSRHYDFTVLAQFIREFSFSNPEGVKSLSIREEQPQIELNLNVEAGSGSGNRYQSHLTTRFNAFRDIKIKDSDETEKQLLFTGYLTYSVLIQLPLEEEFDEESLDPEQKKAHNEKLTKTLMVEVPKLSFPYIRQFISNLTINAGFRPLLIQPMNFEKMYEENKDIDEL